ncbi:hypothetical protein [Xylocopilactobacillus apis]|uniref:Uncharacterized protein n=1 Tax=Xylocopilactobacillus apis TaxID=2932183 RepID=A0AAU9CT15_9LACO|nr:hypothetical protein [Xylocopilactobacillus apis]BDR57149.1 hypothetical protein KIMC2_17110 [Xylocopilactobacillus apis]
MLVLGFFSELNYEDKKDQDDNEVIQHLIAEATYRHDVKELKKIKRMVEESDI